MVDAAALLAAAAEKLGGALRRADAVVAAAVAVASGPQAPLQSAAPGQALFVWSGLQLMPCCRLRVLPVEHQLPVGTQSKVMRI